MMSKPIKVNPIDLFNQEDEVALGLYNVISFSKRIVVLRSCENNTEYFCIQRCKKNNEQTIKIYSGFFDVDTNQFITNEVIYESFPCIFANKEDAEESFIDQASIFLLFDLSNSDELSEAFYGYFSNGMCVLPKLDDLEIN